MSRRRLAVVMTALVVGLLAATQTAAAYSTARALTFRANIGSSCVQGTANDGATIALTWKTSTGAVKANAQIHADPSDGTWQYCTSGSSVIQVGDLLKANDGTTMRKFLVPELSVLQNRVTATYHGRGPAGDYIRVFCRAPLVGEFEPCLTSWKVKVGSTGAWSLSMTYRTVTGGDRVNVRWTSAEGDKVDASSTAPYIAVTRDRAGFTGFANRSIVHVELRDGTTDELLATGKAIPNADGSFAGKFKDAQGRKVPFASGDRVVADIARDADFTDVLEPYAVALTPHEVVGECMQDPYGPSSSITGAVEIYVYREGVLLDSTDAVIGDDATFDVNFDSSFKSTDRIVVACQLTTGDLIQIEADINPIV